MKTTRDNYSMGCAGIAEGTNANTFKITNAFAYNINGRTYQKAATDNIAFSALAGTAFVNLAAKQTTCYFMLIDTAGAVTQKQSSVVPNSQAQAYAKGAWEWPDEPNKACFGALVVDAQNAAVFVPATTDLGAADVVETGHNVGSDYGVPITY